MIQIPSGGTLIKRPGPPGHVVLHRPATELAIPAVIPGAGLGPTINGVATDIITILTADNNFTDVPLAAVSHQLRRRDRGDQHRAPVSIASSRAS